MPGDAMLLLRKPVKQYGAIFKAMNSKERHELRYQRRKAKRESKKQKKLLSFGTVFSYDNLYKSYIRCRKNVGWKASTQRYIVQAPLMVQQTRNKLMNGRFRSAGFYEFNLYERGKKRHIKSVKIEERVVQRCLCDHALVPVIEDTFIYDNGASQKNKGYHFAMNRMKRHLQYHYRKYGTEGYVLLFDFHHFFDEVSHEVVKDIIEKEFDDQRIKDLTYHFIDNFGEKGMGLGSQISQTLALASCNRMDHVIKEKLQVKCYGRYMDDGYLIHPSKEYLKECLQVIRKLCDELGIILNEKKTQIVKLTHGFTWLKGRFFLLESGRVITKIYKKSVVRERRKLKKLRRFYDSGRITADDIWHAYQSWRSYACYFDAYHTVKNMDSLFLELFGKETRVCFTRRLETARL